MARLVVPKAFIIHQRPYRESSALLELFSSDQGRLSVLAKGIKNNIGKNARASLLQLFTPLTISCSGRSELKTLTQIEALFPGFKLQGDRLFSALYLNELIYYLLKPGDAHPELFQAYWLCLEQLLDQPLEASLRRFELQLLRRLGYGIDFYCGPGTENKLQPQKWYRYINRTGFIEVQVAGGGNFLGQHLLDIEKADFSNPPTLGTAKRLLRQLIGYLLSGRKLNSRQLFLKAVDSSS